MQLRMHLRANTETPKAVCLLWELEQFKLSVFMDGHERTRDVFVAIRADPLALWPDDAVLGTVVPDQLAPSETRLGMRRLAAAIPPASRMCRR